MDFFSQITGEWEPCAKSRRPATVSYHLVSSFHMVNLPVYIKESTGKEVLLPFSLNPDVIDANKNFFDSV